MQGFGDMDRYRIVPCCKAYQIVVALPDGGTRVRTWCRTEDEAISHLRLLRQRARVIMVKYGPDLASADRRGLTLPSAPQAHSV